MGSEIARLGVMRLGRARLKYVPRHPRILVKIAGVNRAGQARIEGASITDELNHAPNVVQLRCAGFTPVQGQEVKIFTGDYDLESQLFGGHILSLRQSYEVDRPELVVWDCSCIDYTWLLNRRTVIKRYTNQSATAIIQNLISSFTSGFTTAHVVAGLPTIDEITFTNEDVSDAVTRVMERIGGYWFVDYAKDVHAFVTSTETAGAITQTATRGMTDIAQHVDLSQVATRIVARGGGSNAAADVLVDAATLPVEDISWYAAGGGTVECGAQRIAYTGVSGGGAGSTVPQRPLGAPGSGLINTHIFGVAMPPGWTGYWCFTFYDATGESPRSPLAGLYTNVTGGNADGALTSIDTGPTGTIGRRIYRTKTGGVPSGPFFRVGEIANNSATTFTDNLTDANLGTEMPPTADTTGMAGIAAGSTILWVADTSVFPSSGWVTAGGQMTYYTAIGSGFLAILPFQAPLAVGSAVVSQPHLTGCTGIFYAINKGDPVNLIVTVNDATAQTAMAAWIGSGDGIHEYVITDGRWSIVEATARANAELARRKNPLITVSFNSRDRTLVSGSEITITLTSPLISGTFKIQSVRFSQLGIFKPDAEMWPLRTVECSSQRYSFEDLLRQIGRVA